MHLVTKEDLHLPITVTSDGAVTTVEAIERPKRFTAYVEFDDGIHEMLVDAADEEHAREIAEAAMAFWNEPRDGVVQIQRRRHRFLTNERGEAYSFGAWLGGLIIGSFALGGVAMIVWAGIQHFR
jgi:hypothetical protein